MDLSQKPLLEILSYIELFIDKENSCPLPYIESLVYRIKGCFKAVQLSKIGGESAIIRIKNNDTNEIECLKVARLKIQDPTSSAYKESMAKTQRITQSDKPDKTSGNNGFFSFFKKEEKILKENKNTKIARFLRGCKLQREILRNILKEKDKPDFKIPMVIDYASQPLVHLRQEWLPNTPMLQKIKQVKSIQQKLFYFVKLLRAIDYIHSYGIIHRDIKIDNLMWDGKDSIVLLDWTLAKNINEEQSSLTVEGSFGGTPGIAPPKLISDGNFGEANFLDDIYMLGACFWEFIVGENFPSLRPEASDKEIQALREKQVEYLPDPLQSIFWKATEAKEEDRFPTVVAMKNAVLKAAEYFKEQTITTTKTMDSIVMVTPPIESLCEKCSDGLICKKYKICDLRLKYLQQLKKEGYI